ncbi:hypothetical protein TcWFU_003622 [Taenia crassiceps]|uniref:Uncharacterized protein n=1 Tax=Taenia crassiceps TaxID=6207 RepID=A0ABR4QQI7_9CEST
MVGMPFGKRCTADLPKTDSLTGSVFEANPLSPPPYDSPPTPPYTTVLLFLLIPLSCLHACLPAFLPACLPAPSAREKSTASDSSDGCDMPRVHTRPLLHTHACTSPMLLLWLPFSLSLSHWRSLSIGSFIFLRNEEKTTLTNLN